MEIIKPIYRDENADELNELLEQFLSKLEQKQEEMTTRSMELSLNYYGHKVRDKTFSELMETPQEFHELIDVQTSEAKLNDIILELREIIYSGYEKIPVTEKKSPSPKKYMKKEEIPEYFGKNVKPLILEGITNQYKLAEELDVPSSNLSYWVSKAYGSNWRRYVELVKRGIY